MQLESYKSPVTTMVPKSLLIVCTSADFVCYELPVTEIGGGAVSFIFSRHSKKCAMKQMMKVTSQLTLMFMMRKITKRPLCLLIIWCAWLLVAEVQQRRWQTETPSMHCTRTLVQLLLS